MILWASRFFNKGNVKVVIQKTYFFNNNKTTQLKNGCAMCLVTQLCLTLCDPMDCSPPGSSAHGDSPGKNTGVCCHALLQGIFLTQGWNPGLPHCRQFLSRLSHYKTEIDICSKETKRWPIGTGRGAQYRYLLRKCKSSNLQQATSCSTSHQSEWLSLKKKKIYK